MQQSEPRGEGTSYHTSSLSISHTFTEVEVWGSRVKGALGKSPAGDVYCMENIFVLVYPAEQAVVVSHGACKINLCCCTNGRVLQPGKIQLKFIILCCKWNALS